MEPTDDDILIAAQTLHDWLQGKNKCNREILFRLPEFVSATLEQLELSEVADILNYACFPAEEESSLITDVSEDELQLYGKSA